jgi:ribosomal protein L40E
MTTASDDVHELVRQRDQLRAWIAKLDEVQGTAASRVTERVRADYQDRLRRVTEDLSTHADEIRRGLDEVRGQLAAAEERRTHAIDALEETRLRHVIGELDQGAWDQARQPLEAETAAADEAVAHAQAEVERLSTLSAEIDAGAAQAEPEAEAPAPAEEPAWAPEPVYAEEPEPAAADEQELPFLRDEPEPEPEAAEPDPVSGEDLAAWISEVEAEAGTTPDAAPAPPADEQTAEGWDPFANEFGGAPASPATQPGDAAQDLPWLGALEGGAGAGRWAAPAQADDELAFLDNLESGAPVADDGPAPQLAEDDLAFLEELDRAISGGAASGGGGQTPPPTQLPGNFTGGSGDAVGPPAAEPPAEGEKKSGEALLCKECGAINEPQAWYCEICGSEL